MNVGARCVCCFFVCVCVYTCVLYQILHLPKAKQNMNTQNYCSAWCTAQLYPEAWMLSLPW